MMIILCQHAQQQNNGQDNFTRRQCIWNLFITNCPFLWKRTTVYSGLVLSDHLVVTVSPLLPSEKLLLFLISFYALKTQLTLLYS